MAACANASLEASFLVQANSDISGPGVLTAFMATAYLTLILISVYYLAGCVSPSHLNALDRGTLRWLWSKLPTRWLAPNSGQKLKDIIEKIILMYSDQQLVTGLGILTAGFAQLYTDNIDVDHWQKMIFTAWFSSLTHLATLTVLRDYFKSRNRSARPLRVFLMFALIALLIAALVPTAQASWLLYPAAPARCYYGAGFATNGEFFYDDVTVESNLQNNVVSVTVSVVVLLVSYATRAIGLFDRSSELVWRLSARVSTFARKRFSTTGSNTRRGGLVSYVVMPQVAIFRAFRLIYTSFLWEVLWLLYALLWGTIHLMTAREIGGLIVPSFSGAELPDWLFSNSFEHSFDRFGFDGDFTSFGQLLPVVLLVMPLFSASELFSESTKEPSPPSSGRVTPQMDMSGPSTSVNDNQKDLLKLDFVDFFWFKLYVAVAIATSLCVIVIVLLTFNGSLNSASSALSLTEWIPTAIVYTEIYMLPCCVWELRWGRGNHGTGFKASRSAQAVMVVWALLLLVGGLLSPLGLRFIPPYNSPGSAQS